MGSNLQANKKTLVNILETISSHEMYKPKKEYPREKRQNIAYIPCVSLSSGGASLPSGPCCGGSRRLNFVKVLMRNGRKAVHEFSASLVRKMQCFRKNRSYGWAARSWQGIMVTAKE